MFNLRKNNTYFVIAATFFTIFAHQLFVYANEKVPYIFQYHFIKVVIFILIILVLIMLNYKKYFFNKIDNYELILICTSILGLYISSFINNSIDNDSLSFYDFVKFLYYDKFISSYTTLILLTILLSYIVKNSVLSKQHIIKFIIILLSIVSFFLLSYYMFVTIFEVKILKYKLFYNSSMAYQSCALIIVSYILKKQFSAIGYILLFIINFTLINLILSKGAFLIMLVSLILFIIIDYLKTKKLKLYITFFYLCSFTIICNNFFYENNLVNHLHFKLYTLHGENYQKFYGKNAIPFSFRDNFKQVKPIYLSDKLLSEISEGPEILKKISQTNCNELRQYEKNNEHASYKNNVLLSLKYNLGNKNEFFLSAVSRIGGLIQGWNTFISSPLIGLGVYHDMHICSLGKGVHSAIILILGKFGLIGFVPIFIFFLLELKKMKVDLPKDTILILLLISVLIFENQFGAWFVLFFLLNVKK